MTSTGPASVAPSAYRAFNDTVFSVAYDVFLAARNVKDAFELAREAVRQRPDLPEWRQRLARTAEWTGDPQMARREWHDLGRLLRRPDAYREAIRLAGALRDPAAAVAAWEGLAGLRELEASEWSQFIEAYEGSGEPGRGIERLKRRLGVRPDFDLYLRLIELQMHTDRDGDALASLEAATGKFGNNLALSLLKVEILCRRGSIREAAEVLDSTRSLAASDARKLPLLRLRASVYAWMQRRGDALAAYRQLFAEGQYDLADLRDISGLARESDPELALKAAIAGWLRFNEPEHLFYYLERCIEANRWDLASRMLTRLTPEQWALCSESAYFYVLAARIHQREGRYAQARREYQHALARDPGQEDYQVGYLWLLIEQGRLPELGIYADRVGTGPTTPKALAEPLAIAYKLLQRPKQALAYFRLLHGGGEPADFPSLFAYAEILEQAGDAYGAERAFRRAALELRAAPLPGENRRSRAWQEARARWARRFGASDDANRRIERLLHRYEGNEGTKELAFSWRVERGQNPEDAMSAVRVSGGAGGTIPGAGTAAEERTRDDGKDFPAWARLAVAMRTEAVDKVMELMQNRESGLGDEDRARAAAFLGLHHDAEVYALRAGLGRAGIPEPGGKQLRRGWPGVVAGFDADAHPFYVEHKVLAEVQVPWGPHVISVASVESHSRPWISARLTTQAPDREDFAWVELRHTGKRTGAKLALGLRSAAAAGRGAEVWDLTDARSAGNRTLRLTGAVEYEWRPLDELSVAAGYEGRSVADENPVLALVGLKDRYRALLRLELPAATQFEGAVSRAFFRGRENQYLGDSYHIKFSAAQRLFTLLNAGTSLAYNAFHAGESRPGTDGKARIGGLLADAEFPSTFWHGAVAIEWLSRAPQRPSWSLSPIGSAEWGWNHFPSKPRQASRGSQELALRAGFALQPSAAQRISCLAEYARGLQTLDETETGLSLRYEHAFR